jgi:hypothetical protein
MTASALQPWTVALEAVPTATEYQVEGGPDVVGAFRLVADAGHDPLEAVRPCAEIAGVDLPEKETSDGAPVAWETSSAFTTHAAETGRDGVITDGAAELTYRTHSEVAWIHEHGAAHEASIAVTASAERPVVEVVKKLADYLFDQAKLSGIIRDLLGPLVADADVALNDLLGLAIGERTASATVTYHEAVSASFEVAWDPAYENGYRVWSWTGTSCDGPDGPWEVELRVTGIQAPLDHVSGSGDTTFTLAGGAGHFETSFPVTGFPLDVTNTYMYDTEITGDETTLTFSTVETIDALGVIGSAVVGTAPIVYSSQPCA